MVLLGNILFENNQIIVIDKPSGFLSVPSRMGISDSRPVVGMLLQEYVGKPIFPVHRLDEETSGLLIFAKTPKAQKILSRGFEMHTIQKTYQALTIFEKSFESLRHTVLKNSLFRGKKRSFEAAHGQNAETLVTDAVVQGDCQFLLWSLEPKTGRSHQLRVQLAMRGFPIIGDALYGSTETLPANLLLPPQSLSDQAIGLRAIQLDLSKVKEIESLEVPLVLKAFAWNP